MNSIRLKRKQRQREHTKQWEIGKASSRCRPNWSCVLYQSHAKLMPIRPKDTKSSEPHYSNDPSSTAEQYMLLKGKGGIQLYTGRSLGSEGTGRRQ